MWECLVCVFVWPSVSVLPPNPENKHSSAERLADQVHKGILREARANRDPLCGLNVAMRSLGTVWFERHHKVAFRKALW